MQHTYLINHPQKNLRHKSRKKNTEEIFGIAFTSYFQNKYISKKVNLGHHENLVRELPITNLGISDLVYITWNEKVGQRYNIKLKTFEFKISDWKKGLMQAHRYNFYSHVSILVIPTSSLKKPQANLDLFKKLNVGLWGFDIDKKVITKVYSPRPKKQFIYNYYELAKARIFSILT